MDNITKVNESAEKALKNSEQAKQLIGMIDSFGISMLVTSMAAPHIMKDIKMTDPETYYGLKNALQKFEKMTKEMLPKLSAELERL